MPKDEKESGWELHRRQPLSYQQAISESNTPEKQAFEPAEMVANIPEKERHVTTMDKPPWDVGAAELKLWRREKATPALVEKLKPTEGASVFEFTAEAEVKPVLEDALIKTLSQKKHRDKLARGLPKREGATTHELLLQAHDKDAAAKSLKEVVHATGSLLLAVDGHTDYTWQRGFNKLNDFTRIQLRDLLQDFKEFIDSRAELLCDTNDPLDALTGLQADIDRISSRLKELDAEDMSLMPEETMLASMDEKDSLEENLRQAKMEVMRHISEVLSTVEFAFAGEGSPDQCLKTLSAKLARTTKLCLEEASMYRGVRRKLLAAITDISGRQARLKRLQQVDQNDDRARRIGFAGEMQAAEREEQRLSDEIKQRMEQLNKNKAAALRKIATNDVAETESQARRAAREVTERALVASKAQLEPWVDACEPSAAVCEHIVEVAATANKGLRTQVKAKAQRAREVEAAYAAESHAVYCDTASKLTVEVARKEHALQLAEHGIEELQDDLREQQEVGDPLTARKIAGKIKKKQEAMSPHTQRLQQCTGWLEELKDAEHGLPRALTVLARVFAGAGEGDEAWLDRRWQPAARQAVRDRSGGIADPPAEPGPILWERHRAAENTRRGNSFLEKLGRQAGRDKEIAEQLGVGHLLLANGTAPLEPVAAGGSAKSEPEVTVEATEVGQAAGGRSSWFRVPRAW